MTSAAVRQGSSAVRDMAGKLGYYTYTGVERAGGRQRYFRNLKSHEWMKLYGQRYWYSSDFIQANPKAHGKVVGNMARAANRTEELGEMAFRFTGGYCRLAGGLALRSLREMTGAPRFSKRVRRFMAQYDLQLPAQADTEALAFEVTCQLRLMGKLNYKGCLHPSITNDQIAQALLKADVYKDLSEAEFHTYKWRKILQAANVVRRTAPMTFTGRCAMAVGCTLSSVGFAIGYGFVAAAFTGLEATFMAKVNMLGAALYGTAFLIRTATFVAANVSKTFNPHSLSMGHRVRNYDGLFELTGQHLVRIRNRAYYKMGIEPDGGYLHSSRLPAHRISQLDEYARREAAMMVKDPQVNYVARGLFWCSNALNRMTDVIFSMDRIIGLGFISTPIKHFGYDYHGEMKHQQLLDANGKCNITRRYRASQSNGVLARTRRGAAYLIGHGGADCLGMMVGCAVCSAAWTGLNIPMGGSMFTVPLAGGVVAGVGIGFASVGAAGWGASALADGAARGADWIGEALTKKEASSAA